MVFLLALLAAADVKPAPARNYKIDDASRGKTLELRVATGVVTSVHFPSPVLVEDVVCGNPGAFVIKPTLANTQLNFGPQPSVGKSFATNCNVPLSTGLTVTIGIIASATPDTFVDVLVELKTPPTPAPVKTTIDESAVEERVFKVEKQCQDEHEQVLVDKAAQAIVMRHINERAIHDFVILAVLDHVKIGSRGLLRFSVENHTRVPWAAGAVRVSFYVPGKDVKVIETKAGFTKPIAGVAEEIFGAVSFEMIDLPADAKFSLEVLERNGSRHPKVDGFRL
ncbi:MAG: DUF2381 family protein [Deltaproteobacteria bacterium]|nr:DUF2381 family protein [Deltaproteobacteria bacterium]